MLSVVLRLDLAPGACGLQSYLPLLLRNASSSLTMFGCGGSTFRILTSRSVKRMTCGSWRGPDDEPAELDGRGWQMYYTTSATNAKPYLVLIRCLEMFRLSLQLAGLCRVLAWVGFKLRMRCPNGTAAGGCPLQKSPTEVLLN
jgi:hypothetical protein